MQTNEIDIKSARPKSLRRVFIRWFVGLALLVIAIDTAPSFQILAPIQAYLRPVLNLTGLWQGEWPLFAPNPIINNGWISAEFYEQGSSTPMQASDGKALSWNSPIWSECSAWSKFYRFRHLNYYNRVAFRGPDVVYDLADFIAREELGPSYRFVDIPTNESEQTQGNARSVELRLSKNGLKIVLPEDGSLPPPEEITWIYVGSGLATRKYAP